MAAVEICALCREEKKLQKSHILPELLYDRLYDGLHSFQVLSTNPKANRPRRRQGIYERLLCSFCDQHRLGRLDNYAANLLKGGIEIEVTDLTDRLIVGNLNYKTLKLWQMSLLWRCGVSSRAEFRATRLGPHAEKLRRFLVNEDPGQPHEYGCTIVLPSSHAVMEQVIMPPEPVTIQGQRCYRAWFGALWWVFVVSSHSASFPFQEGFLQESGVFSIFKESTNTSTFILKLGKDLGAFGEVERKTLG